VTGVPRHAIDSVEFLAVTGWAVNAEGLAGEVSLWLAGAPLTARVDRVERADVLGHLGLPTGALRCGFELRPEPTAWLDRVDDEPLICELRIDGQAVEPVAIGLPETELQAWIDAASEPPDTPAREADASRLLGFLQALHRADGLLDAQAAWARRGDSRPAGWCHAVDRIDGLRVIGWVLAPGVEAEIFSVHCHGRHWPAEVRRVPREDVRQAMAGAGPLVGFELDLPPALWLATGGRGDAWFQIRVNGWNLWPTPRRLRRAGLMPALKAACEQAAASGVVDPDAGYRFWHLVDHVVAARVLAELPASTGQRLRHLMSDEDRARWQQAVDAAAGNTRAGATEDPVAPQVWQLQRALNERLGAASSQRADTLDAAVEQVLTDHSQTLPQARQWFLAGLVPVFCAADALPRLRPRLTVESLDLLARHEGRWELSLLLPVQLLDELPHGHLSGALATMQRLARPGQGGWLNTESVHDAVRRLAAALRAGEPVDDTEVARFIDTMLILWADLALDPPWNRLHDAQLLQAQCLLLDSLPQLGCSQADRVVQAALRHYALVPSFWVQWQRSAPDIGQWPPALASAYRQLQGLSGTGATHWAWARGLGCVEVDALQRHALVAARHEPCAAETALAGLPPADALRVVARGPQAEAAWRSLGTVPWPDHAVRREQAWHASRRLVAGADEAAWVSALAVLRSACGERVGFIGLPLLLHVACATRQDAPRSHRAHQALAAAVPAVLAACERRPAEHLVPPPALCAAWAGSAPWPDTWAERATRLWGSRWPPAVLAATGEPGAGVLVVLRTGQEHAPGALERIASGWAAGLQQLAPGLFDFRVWDPTGRVDAAPWPLLHAPTLAGLLQALPGLGGHHQFVLLDDDTALLPEAWLARTEVLTAHYHGLADAGPLQRFHRAADGGVLGVDASPESTLVARVSTGLVVSRAALSWAASRAGDPACPTWARASHDDEKCLADLLQSLGLPLSQRGQWLAQARRPLATAPARPYADLPAPGPGLPTVMLLGPDPGEAASSRGPSRIWPTDRPPGWHGAAGSQQLVRLHDPFDGTPLRADEVGVVAVARNERLLLPHFLAHYRGLGVRRFVIADNLSTDGTREFLAQQPDVTLYSVDTPYRLSHYGVAWQLAMLAEHAQGRWALVVDIDEFLVWPGCERESLVARCERLQAAGHDAAWALMVDMYPQGPLDNADFTRGSPFAEAPCFDTQPALPWRLGSGSFSNSPSFVSSVRHRLLPGSPPNHYTSQKVPLVRYQPGLRWSEGLHYAAGVQLAPEPMFLAHFKYHGGFRAKVEEEIARKQHYNDAEEYRKYRALWAEARGMMFDPAVSRRYLDSHSFADIAWN
jgi:hypothetical protein